MHLEAQIKETLEFIELHGHHNLMVKDAKSLNSIQEVIYRMAACQSACRDAHGPSSVCHPWRRLHRLRSEPARPTA